MTVIRIGPPSVIVTRQGTVELFLHTEIWPQKCYASVLL